MMAVDSPRRTYLHDHPISHSSTRGSTDKQMTPFSIDDILSKSKKMNRKSAERFLGSIPLSSFFPQRTFDLPPNLMPGNQSRYSNWLERFQRACMASFLHPLWLSSHFADPKFMNAFYDHLQIEANFQNHVNTQDHQNVTQHFLMSLPKHRSQPEYRKRKHSSTSSSPQSYDKCTLTETRRAKEQKLINGDGLFDKSPKSSAMFDKDRSKVNKRPNNDSPLSALEKLTCSTFEDMKDKQNILHAIATGQETKIKRRKCRTAFTTFQLSVLEQRFSCHKYLTPTDRDKIAHILGLSAPQVITWFQNRRAKQKRDLEEMKNDIKTVKKWNDKEHGSVDDKTCSSILDDPDHNEMDEIDVESC